MRRAYGRSSYAKPYGRTVPVSLLEGGGGERVQQAGGMEAKKEKHRITMLLFLVREAGLEPARA